MGLILCARKDSAVAIYALENLPNKVMASEYKTTLPDEKLIAAEMERTRRNLDFRKTIKKLPPGKQEEDKKNDK